METNEIKTKLEEEKNTLLSELGDMAKQDEEGKWIPVPVERDSSVADENDNADRDEDYEERASMTETLAKRLADVETALGNLGSEKYGVCTLCGNKIEEDRLAANPAAQTCKSCMNM